MQFALGGVQWELAPARRGYSRRREGLVKESCMVEKLGTEFKSRNQTLSCVGATEVIFRIGPAVPICTAETFISHLHIY